jgi:CRAL/TRIO domain
MDWPAAVLAEREGRHAPPGSPLPPVGAFARKGSRNSSQGGEEEVIETTETETGWRVFAGPEDEGASQPVQQRPKRTHRAPATVLAELFPLEQLSLALLREKLEDLGVAEWRDPSSSESSEQEKEDESADPESGGKSKKQKKSKSPKKGKKEQKLSKEALARRKARLEERVRVCPILLPFDPLEDAHIAGETGDTDASSAGKAEEGDQVGLVWASERLDRFLCACLQARKFDLDRVVTLLENNTAWRREWGCSHGWPTFESVEETARKLDMMYSCPGARGKHGGTVMYLELARFVPKDADFTVQDWMQYNKWFASQGALMHQLDSQRNGVIIVEDLAGVSLKNMGFGTEFTGKEAQNMQNSLIDCFPMRIHKLLILNAPSFLKMMLRLAKSMGVKKKILKRVQVLPRTEDLADFIEPAHLVTQHGGELEFDHGRMFDALVEWNREWSGAQS